MRADDLVRMANQIGHFFAPYPESDAIDGIRDHLAKFWDPAMRQSLRELAAEQERRTPTEPARGAGRELDPLVLRAVVTLQQKSTD